MLGKDVSEKVLYAASVPPKNVRRSF